MWSEVNKKREFFILGTRFLYCEFQIILIYVLPSIMYDSLSVLGYVRVATSILQTKTFTFLATCNKAEAQFLF